MAREGARRIGIAIAVPSWSCVVRAVAATTFLGRVSGGGGGGAGERVNRRRREPATVRAGGVAKLDSDSLVLR